MQRSEVTSQGPTATKGLRWDLNPKQMFLPLFQYHVNCKEPQEMKGSTQSPDLGYVGADPRRSCSVSTNVRGPVQAAATLLRKHTIAFHLGKQGSGCGVQLLMGGQVFVT